MVDSSWSSWSGTIASIQRLHVTLMSRCSLFISQWYLMRSSSGYLCLIQYVSCNFLNLIEPMWSRGTMDNVCEQRASDGTLWHNGWVHCKAWSCSTVVVIFLSRSGAIEFFLEPDLYSVCQPMFWMDRGWTFGHMASMSISRGGESFGSGYAVGHHARRPASGSSPARNHCGGKQRALSLHLGLVVWWQTGVACTHDL